MGGIKFKPSDCLSLAVAYCGTVSGDLIPQLRLTSFDVQIVPTISIPTINGQSHEGYGPWNRRPEPPAHLRLLMSRFQMTIAPGATKNANR